MTQQQTNEIYEITDETAAFTDEFTFELEELDGKRASAIIVALDPPQCPSIHFC